MAHTTFHAGMQTASSPNFAEVLHERLAGFHKSATTLLAQLRPPVALMRPTRAQEAERVRALASTYRTSDPGFADDLFAAADRHELKQDA